MARRPAGPAHPGAVRPRYGRIASAAGSALVTVVALLGATGALPGVAPSAEPGSPSDAVALASFDEPDEPGAPNEPGMPASTSPRAFDPGLVTPRERSAALPVAGSVDSSEALPADSGTGRRVVFSMSTQRVWLVEKGDHVARTYLVSGSLTDNLSAGTYEVYSTSRDAVGIDDSGTMKYMVRFAHGERAAIGFHDIPVKDGERLQTRAQLGTPQSHGCIRQWRPDARALWDFAPVGTTVVVVA